MTAEVKEKFRTWISQFLDSTHPLDSRRLYDLVIALHDTETAIYDEDIRQMINECKPNWNKDYIEIFIHEKQLLISELHAFLDYYRIAQ